MITLQEPSQEEKISSLPNKPLSLEATLQELSLHNFQMECTSLTKEVVHVFETNPYLPGVVLIEDNQLVGMISRRRLLEQMSRPYGLELFLNRPLSRLCQFIKIDTLVLSGNTLIVEAARLSLERHSVLLDEPILVHLDSCNYQILDIHQLLVAQSKIYQLTSEMLEKETQEKLFQTEKLASLGKMMAGIAHEIKNPINCIHGNTGFLKTYYQDLLELVQAYEKEFPNESLAISELKEDIEFEFLLEDLPKVLETVQVASNRVTSIISGLRHFSHMDGNKRQLTKIHDCLDTTLAILNNRTKRGVKIIKNYGNIPEIAACAGLLSQVFMNLLANALDTLDEKQEKNIPNWQPQIEITTSNVQLEGKDFVSIQISDNGLGIPPEIQQRIFETFFTTKGVGKGTGLGLAISYQIITEKHGGKLQMGSEEGMGTEFEILLPKVME